MQTALAPMVRLGTLPLRLLSLERGADLVYTEELVDAKLAASTRTVDEQLGTTDWRGAGGQCVLRTCALERGKLVVQLGTADPEGALAAARQLFDPADPGRDGIVQLDVNMGCPTLRWSPKECTVAGGSGAALFADRLRAEAVVAALRAFLPTSIVLSCKVRLCEAGPEATIERCRGLVAAGASLIAVHARSAADRPRDPARWDEVARVVNGMSRITRVCVNGDALDDEACAELRRTSGCNNVLVARGALLAGNAFGREHTESGYNALSRDLCESTLRLCRRYAEIAITWDNHPLNTAFVLQWMLHARIREREHEQLAGAGACGVGGGGDAAGGAAGGDDADADAHGLAVLAARLKRATRSSDVAEALSLGDHLGNLEQDLGERHRSRQQAEVAPPAHRYRADYFDDLKRRTDWAAALPRAVIAARRAWSRGESAAGGRGAPSYSNDDFRRLALSGVCGSGVGGSGVGGSGVGGRADGGAGGGKRKGQEVDYMSLLQQRAAALRRFVRVFVLEQRPPQERHAGSIVAAATHPRTRSGMWEVK